MMLSKKLKSMNIFSRTFMVLALLLLSGIANAQVSKNIWMYVYNSDGSSPETGDITIRTYLKKNPTNVLVSTNIQNGWNFDINNSWGFYPNPEEASTNNATIGDEIVIEFTNNSSSTFDGEQRVLTSFLDSNMWQQLGDNNFALPVELSGFEAVNVNNTVRLQWTTETETLNLGFNIYRTVQGSDNFVKINDSLIPGSGTSSEKHAYSFEDKTTESGKTYSYKIQNIDTDGRQKFYKTVSVEVTFANVPAEIELSQNYPNPFNPTTTIKYNLPRTAKVTLYIYNILGDIVRELVNEQQAAGSYSVTWDGLNSFGLPAATGMYFYQMQADSFSHVKKMTLKK